MYTNYFLFAVEDLSSSIGSIDILNYTKSSVKLKLHFHPHLMNYDLEYEVTVKQLHTNLSHQRPFGWKLKTKFMDLQIKNLDAMTSYVVDVMVKYQGIERPRKTMKTPFVFRIKGAFYHSYPFITYILIFEATMLHAFFL